MDPERLEAMMAAMGGIPAGMSQQMPITPTMRRDSGGDMTTPARARELSPLPEFDEAGRGAIEQGLGGQYAGPFTPEAMEFVSQQIDQFAPGLEPSAKQRLIESLLTATGMIDPSTQPRSGPNSGMGMGQGHPQLGQPGFDPIQSVMDMLTPR